MSKKLIIGTIIITLLVSSIILFFVLSPIKLSEKILSSSTEEGITMKGQVYEYIWIKSVDNYDYAHCHVLKNPALGAYVFKSENSTNDFEYSIQFKEENINIDDYKNKTITVKGDKIIKHKEMDMSCGDGNPKPQGVCENSDTAIFTCKKIINAVIIK